MEGHHRCHRNRGSSRRKRSLDQQKGDGQQRDRMLGELPTVRAVDKQVADMAQELASLKQKLKSILPNRYNQAGPAYQDYHRNNERPSTPGNNRSEFSRPREKPSTPLYENQICFYCHRESHTTYRCPDFFKDEELARPIRSAVAAASADPKMMEAADKLAKSRRVAFASTPRPPTPPAFKSLAQTVNWEPPQLGAENFLKTHVVTRSDAQRGRRSTNLDEDRMDVDQQEEREEPTRKEPRVAPEKVWSKDKTPAKSKKALIEELDHIKIPTTFAQLTAISPSYAEQVISKLQEQLAGRSNATYIVDKTTQVASAMTTQSEEEPSSDPCYYSCALGYVLAEVGEGKADFMIDSGSMVNVIPQSVAEDLDLEVVQIDIPMKGVGGARCDITRVVKNCLVAIGRFSGPAHLFVSPKAQDCILGRPFPFDYSCTLEYHDKGETLSFKGTKGRRVSVPLARIGQGRGWNNKKDLSTNTLLSNISNKSSGQEHRMFKKKLDQSFL
ncbi:hypothetical protein PSTG_11176 [Puccinia striiformis f. sp. tritici PST-78]|uniref:Peptidase A2 domain-containing protein n=1 Tax=Puccinia striiformis f. sp. tritici PST-78 TaxID=1165861 RepID=A0A0L0V927_9BASI|nr:hypothetical protein PSTG_11176 [Puccinia striiformis f. sp. tritici PST-78]